MSPNNQIQVDGNRLGKIQNSESFYKWFLEVLSKISEISVDTIHEDFVRYLTSPITSLKDDKDYDEESEEDDDDDLVEKRRVEKIKKYLGIFSDADVLLEFLENAATDWEFVTKFCPLETVAILGGIGFFKCCLKRRDEALEAFEKLAKFTGKYENLEQFEMSYLIGIKSVVSELMAFYHVVFEDFCPSSQSFSLKSHNQLDESDLLEESSSNGTFDSSTIIMGIKNYFLTGFQIPEIILEEQAILMEQILAKESEKSEFFLNRFQIRRALRLAELSPSKNTLSCPSDAEKLDTEFAFKLNPSNPWNILGVCQFLTDYLAGMGPNALKFGEMRFKNHSEIVTFIKDSATEISEKYPSFLRAHCTFAEIFANELPITRQDKGFAKSLLNNAWKANPTSSKINHKMALCLLKSRQFSEAKGHIQKSIELDPSNATAHYTLVKLLLRDPTGSNKETLETVFNVDFEEIIKSLGPENQLAFWKASYFFITGDRSLAVDMWAEIILEFYVQKPELDLATVLPFQELRRTTSTFFWTRSPFTLENVDAAVRTAISMEKTRRRVVLNRLLDLVTDALSNKT